MASGEEDEVLLQETGARRTTRATRAVATRKSRGRKKAAASPRTTRSKRSTRAAQSAESDDVEEDDDEVQEEAQNTSDAEAPADQTDEQTDQASPEVEKMEDEQTPPAVIKDTEESTTVENGVMEENHDSNEHETMEVDKSTSEETVTPGEKKKEVAKDKEPEPEQEQKEKEEEKKQNEKVEKQKEKGKEKVEEQKEKGKVEEQKQNEKVDEQKQKEKVEPEQNEKVEDQKQKGKVEEQKQKGKVEEQKEKEEEQKEKEKVKEQKEKERVEKQKEKEKVEKQKEKEKVEKQKEKEKAEKQKEKEKVEEQKEKEKVEEQKEKEKVEEQKEKEKVEEQKEKEKVEEQKEKEKVEKQKEKEKVEERKETEKVEEQKEKEKVDEQKEKEKVEQKGKEKVEEQKGKEKVEEQKGKEKVEEQKQKEKVEEQKQEERMEVQKDEVKDVGEEDKKTENGKGEEPEIKKRKLEIKTEEPEIKSDEVKVEKELNEVKMEVESVTQGTDDKEVPELEDAPPPTINTVLPSPIRSGLKIKVEATTPTNTEESQDVPKEVSEEKDTKETSASRESGDEAASENEKAVSVKKEEEPMEVDEPKQESEVAQQATESTESHLQEEDTADIKPENVEEMTVIDEVTEEGGQEEKNEATSESTSEKVAAAETGDTEGGFRTEPDTEMVSEDELPTESSKEPLETEAVSDEELPDPAAAVDLPETEAVSEDELPPEKTDKKKKKSTKQSAGSGKKKSRSEAQKRKLADGDTYDPSSPTSENSCDESPAAKRAAVAGAGGSAQAKPVTKTRKSLPELEKYWKAVKEDPSDFTGWTYLLQYVDQENDIDAAREAYDAFLSHYPYCYGYWRKYADYEKRKGNKEKCEEVFERGLKAIPLSVDLWIHFLNYSKATYADNEEHLRTQFEKAINACGMEFRSDRLWESYIKWETEGKRFQNVTNLYDRLLAMPTQGYTNHFDNFQEHISSNPPQKVLSVDEFLTLRREVLQLLKQYDQPAAVADDAAPGEEVEAPPGEEPEEQPVVKSDEETTALRERIIFIRRKVHKATVTAVSDRWNFEEGIKRPYFHVKPLERCQLKNWKEYLDFEIEQGDHERIVVLFERCLIACALYEEFWIKFIRYLESLKGDMIEKIRNVYERACMIHHTKKPNLHLHWAVFEESHKNYDKASEILSNLEKLVPNMLQVAYRRINLERRCNNMDKVCGLYEHYIANTKNKVISNNMAIKYARFCWKVKEDIEKAISVLNKAVEKDKDNPRLYLQLIDMGLQQNPLNEDNIISIIDQFLNRDTDPEQKVLFAQRKVEFLEDFGSDILSVQKAHDEFQRYFKQAKDRKKKSPDLDGKSLDGSSKKVKGLSDSMQMHSSHAQSHTSPQTTHSSTSQQPPQPPSGSQTPTATTSTGQYPPANYNQTGGYSQQPPAQGGYQGGQYPPAGPQQPPTPYNQPPYNQQYGQSSDPNYANYQNWGYSQTGYGGYNQGWGNYNYY